MSDGIENDLRQQLANGRAVLVVGSGVSIAATNRAKAASWQGLLELGVEHCVTLDGARRGKWESRKLEDVHSPNLHDLLSAATNIAGIIRKEGEWSRWLSDTVGQLQPVRPEILAALGGLNAPIVTTNYDALLDSHLQRRAITWQDSADQIAFHRLENRDCILHLHGVWHDAESVVLGADDYARIVGHKLAQSGLRALGEIWSLVFVGCGDGLSDPNFGPFLDWMGEVLKGARHRHFRLERTADVKARQEEHTARGDRVRVLSYGDKHEDLPGFLRSQGVFARKTPSSPTKTTNLPGRRLCIGRQREVEQIVATVIADRPLPIPVLGTGGVGKSTVCIEALHDMRSAAKFGDRRFFLRCDGMRSAGAIVAELATRLGLPVGTSAGDVLGALAAAPTMLVLDNAETPLDAEREQVEELVAEFAGVSGLGLVVALRRNTRPGVIHWAETVRILPLPDSSAREVFLKIAGKRFAADPDIDELLSRFDGLPLAVMLVARVAEPEPALSSVVARWKNERTRVAGIGPGKDYDLDASFELSLKSDRLTEGGRQVLSVLALLPDGVAYSDLETVLPGQGAALGRIREMALAFDEGDRLRVLAPLREYLVANYPVAEPDRVQAVSHYVRLARLGDDVLKKEGAAASARLAAEFGNCVAAIEAGLASSDEASIEAALSLADFIRASGAGTSAVLERALETASQSGNIVLQARCLEKIGDIALARSDHDGARSRFEKALPLYRRVGDLLGEANCIKMLGLIASARSDHDGARARFEEALSLYRRVGHVLGEANCIKCLGGIALARSDHDGARARYEEALPLYRRVDNVLGEAGCIQCLGDIALRRSDHERARSRYEEALPLLRRVGSVRGEAGCIQRLGDIALRRSDHDGARTRYEEALPLHRRVGDVLGEANCIYGLGDIALRRSDEGGAWARYEEALALYRRVGDVLGEANCIKGLGNIALARSNHEGARAGYEKALPLYRRVGAVLGEANCIRSLGDLALARSDHDGARAHYEEALPLYRRVGAVLGEATCIRSLGDLALARSDHGETRARYHEALALYERIQEPFSIGWTLCRLARVTSGAERDQHVASARAAWTSIKRPDLVSQLDAEFVAQKTG
jgi:tetratricopeptide (TPR) repeat protein